ncbi:hypothetical protein F5B22DRAFT_256688 [Xylaria bambusicola]|uniref:uncharacterized protein n=1 Tax=Xylaria bambusicola TaxID=326684 RepID=UPI00200759DF|nr:uncharacterized protein F5B22DRAFT_256688 [Xylaria bambusicola]KAI0525856.1 hypothetical protein F5B22DRAFT_256688 [Xylaria bambusicola]
MYPAAEPYPQTEPLTVDPSLITSDDPLLPLAGSPGAELDLNDIPTPEGDVPSPSALLGSPSLAPKTSDLNLLNTPFVVDASQGVSPGDPLSQLNHPSLPSLSPIMRFLVTSSPNQARYIVTKGDDSAGDAAPASLSGQDPVSAHNAPNWSGIDPVPSNIFPRETSPTSDRRRARCHVCRQADRESSMYRTCVWIADPIARFQSGCTTCKTYGLVCVVDGVALAPNPHAKYNSRWVPCTACSLFETNCERQRPCTSCIARGTPQTCPVEGFGVFRRGTGLGTELYAYLSLGKPGQEPQIFDSKYSQPPDYHIQYVRWLEGGPVPVPPGYTGPPLNPPRPKLSLRILNLPLPSASPRVVAPPNPPLLPGQRSERTCFNCKRIRRQCDRQMPCCSRCATKGVQCVYSSSHFF